MLIKQGQCVELNSNRAHEERFNSQKEVALYSTGFNPLSTM